MRADATTPTSSFITLDVRMQYIMTLGGREQTRVGVGKEGERLLLPSSSSWMVDIESDGAQLVLVSCRSAGRLVPRDSGTPLGMGLI